MTSVALGLFILAIVYVVVWSIKNDGARSIREQRGLIRMRPPADERSGKEARRPSSRRSAAPSDTDAAGAASQPRP